jgi:hypothetical protein
MEQLGYNLLLRWFVGLSLDDAIWDETVFTKNRERLIEGDIAHKFMAAVLSQEAVKALLSDDHFSVDGSRSGSRSPSASSMQDQECCRSRCGASATLRRLDCVRRWARRS